MRKLLIAALLATPTAAAASPAPELHLDSTPQARVGAFAGIQLRLALGGPTRERRVRAAATIAPAVHIRDAAGARTMRTGEGAALSFRPDGRISFSLAGEDLTRARLGGAFHADEADDGGVPSWAIALGGLAAGAGIGYLVLVDAIGDCDPGNCN